MNDGQSNPSADDQFATARALHQQGQLSEAEAVYRAAIARNERHSDAKEGLGVLHLQRGEIEKAVRLLDEAAALCPTNAGFHDNLAAALLQANRPDQAAAALERSIAAAPTAIDSRMKLGDLLLKLGRRGRAMETYKQAIELDPQLRAVCRDTSQILDEEARCNTVLANCQHILARYPRYAPAHYRKACALLNLGRIEEARRTSEQALVIDPTVPTYYHILVHTGEAKHIAAALGGLESLACYEEALSDQDRATLHFLLAKAYDSQKRMADAFTHLQKANAAKRETIRYDEAREIDRLKAIADAFSSERMQQLCGHGNPSPLPVFVVGMPRSGTTLVEQILASHPEIHGAGELSTFADLATRGVTGEDFPAGFAAISPAALDQLAERYLAKVSAIGQGAKRVVDKLPTNFRFAGLIHLALPGARIIHVKRDPLDTCFSCYSQTFAGDIGFAYDLGELGRYYRAYDALMEHWRRVLPQGVMLEVQYEEMVNDLPTQAKRMVGHCGLEWHQGCLEFHKTRRAVASASLYQVRQPLFQSAIGRAQAYSAHLAPLRQALGLS